MEQQLTPTRSNLLQTREMLTLAREGHEILDKKREVLTNMLLQLAEKAQAQQAALHAALATAYAALAEARQAMGRERLEWVALAVQQSVEVNITLHSIMGVATPTITPQDSPPTLTYSPGDTPVILDEAVAQFRAAAALLPETAATLTAVWRLARELQKTQRRVNALQYVLIPRYEAAVSRIENALEEREREETFRLKRLKGQREINNL